MGRLLKDKVFPVERIGEGGALGPAALGVPRQRRRKMLGATGFKGGL